MVKTYMRIAISYLDYYAVSANYYYLRKASVRDQDIQIINPYVQLRNPNTERTFYGTNRGVIRTFELFICTLRISNPY